MVETRLFSFETSRGSAIQDLLNPTVPLPAWRTGNFSALAPGVVVRDPVSVSPFPNNQIPASRINPVSQRIQHLFWPLPNFGSSSALSSQNSEFRASASNAFNRVVLAPPDFNLTSPTFGKITQPQGNSPRNIQLGLKFYF